LQIGLQVDYADTTGAFTKTGFIRDIDEQDSIKMYSVDTAAFVASELRLIKPIETGCPFDEPNTYNPSTLIN